MNPDKFLKDLYKSKDKTSIESLELCYEFTEINVKNKNFKAIDTALKNIDFNKTNFMIPVSIIRCTFRFKNELKQWEFCKEKSIKNLKENNRNYISLLRGLG